MLQAARNHFAEFWAAVVAEAEKLGLDEPSVPRKRRIPRRFDDGSEGHTFPTPERFYQQQYFALIDTALGSLDSRFASDTWKFFADVERALTAPNTSADVGVISDFFGDDLDGDRLKLHSCCSRESSPADLLLFVISLTF